MNNLENLALSLGDFIASKSKVDALPTLILGEVRIPLVVNLRDDAVDFAEDVLKIADEIRTLRLRRAECEADVVRVLRANGYEPMNNDCLTYDFDAAIKNLRDADNLIAATERGLIATLTK